MASTSSSSSSPTRLAFLGFDTTTDCSDLSNCGTATLDDIDDLSSRIPDLHAPYTLQSAVSVERQVTKAATVSADISELPRLRSVPNHQCECSVSRNAVLPQLSRSRAQNVYHYVSEGNFKQNQLIVNSNVRIGSKVQIFGFYTLDYANSDTSGVSSFPSNSYNISQDYGRGAFDIRHRLFLGGSIGLAIPDTVEPVHDRQFGFSFQHHLALRSEWRLRNTTIVPDSFRRRRVRRRNAPAGSAIYCTPYGTFDATGCTGTPLPINYGTGPNAFVMNLRLTKTFGFGAKTKKRSGQGQGGGPGGPGGGGPGGGGGPRGPLFGGGGGDRVSRRTPTGATTSRWASASEMPSIM